MKIRLKSSGIRTGKPYSGFITRHIADDSRLLVYVELDKEKGHEYVYILPIDVSMNSQFGNFARKMKIVDEHSVADTEELDGIAVVVVLKKGKDNNIYVSCMEVNYEYYENLEDEETDEDMEDYCDK